MVSNDFSSGFLISKPFFSLLNSSEFIPFIVGEIVTPDGELTAEADPAVDCDGEALFNSCIEEAVTAATAATVAVNFS